MPTSPDEWLKISKEFHLKWNLPQVVGALNGKQICISCPSKTGSLYHNYKGFFSMVLLTVCNANYQFNTFEFGQYRSNNDSGVLLKKVAWEKKKSSSKMISTSLLPTAIMVLILAHCHTFL